jgi:hypothetical protein
MEQVAQRLLKAIPVTSEFGEGADVLRCLLELEGQILDPSDLSSLFFQLGEVGANGEGDRAHGFSMYRVHLVHKWPACCNVLRLVGKGLPGRCNTQENSADPPKRSQRRVLSAAPIGSGSVRPTELEQFGERTLRLLALDTTQHTDGRVDQRAVGGRHRCVAGDRVAGVESLCGR